MKANTQPILQLNQVDVRYGDRPVLENIDLDVYPGEFIGLIGPNGAGKTTLLRVILGMLAPSGGHVVLAGQAVRHGSRQVGYVPQKIHLEPDTPLRGRDLVGLGLDGHRFGIPVPSRTRRQKIEEALVAVDAMHFANAPVGRLSGGEQQRLLIAQALLSNPKVMLLDEPLSNLDIKSAHEVVRLVSEVAKKRCIAVMMVAHDMNPLLPAMDKVMYLANGQAVTGAVNDVIRSEVLSLLYGYDVEVLRVQDRVIVVGGEGGGYDVLAPSDGSHCAGEEVAAP